VTTAKELLGEIDTIATKRVLEADELAAADNTDKAAEVYQEVARSFGSAPAAKLAKSKLAVLRQDPEIAAKFLLSRARAYADQKRPDVALKLLREIAGKYAKTAAASPAAKMIEELETAAAGERLSRARILAARKNLIIGNIHALNGRTEEALECYHRVILEFEDTRFADTARRKIASLEKK
jgi:tetratricopeptide (TPR) repeat protein